MDTAVLNATEQRIHTLRSLYHQHGYAPYRMGKFEEYDLYSRNKDFLVSDSVITFTDTNGKLMALKPDVTLSIIKNNPDIDSGIKKLYYNENVYRVSKGTNSFREIMQVGLECLGEVDDFCIGEVLWLAAESLQAIAPAYVLEVSHLGILTKCIAALTADPALTQEILKCAGEKNLHGIAALCERHGIAPAAAAPLRALLTLYGPIAQTLPQLQTLAAQFGAEEEAASFVRALSIFNGYEGQAHICMDFSAVSDTRYYNGVVFKGFADQAPERVLSGGQYDRLMHRLGQRTRAIGFAVYLDLLDRLTPAAADYDADLLLLYDATAEPSALRGCISNYLAQGLRVAASRTRLPGRYRSVLRFQNGEVIADGTDA